MFLDRGDDVARLEVAASEPEAAGVERRDVVGGDRRQPGVRQRLAAPGARVLDPLPHGGTDLTHEREVDRQRLVGALEHHHRPLPPQQSCDVVRRKGRNIVTFTTPTLRLRSVRR
jgi:hypothetical protein